MATKKTKNEGEPPKGLTPDDPVPSETLKELTSLDRAHLELGGQLLAVEQERVRILSTAHQVEQQRKRLFEAILMERGMSPSTEVEIDSTTGKLTVMNRNIKASRG